MKRDDIRQVRLQHCRICDASDFQRVILLEDMPFTDEFVKTDEIGSEFLADIEIAVCKSCGCAQNMHDTEMGAYYRDYTYTVQSSPFAIRFMKTLASRIRENYFSKQTNPKVLEIGSGSGEQLMEFKKNGFDVLGIEPSSKLSQFANNSDIKTVTAFFDEHTKEILDPDFKQFDAVISSYTFDHIPRPVEVLKNIHNILSPEGILVLEVHDLNLIAERNEFCLFEHEHYTYLNEHTMTHLLHQNKFEVITFQLLTQTEKRANSLLVVARKADHVPASRMDVKAEISKLNDLNDNIRLSIERIDAWLTEHHGKTIVAYGAGGRGIMTIAALKHPELIRFMVDKNPKSTGIFSPKSHLPVYGIEQLGKIKADKILVFSFGYYQEIVQELGSKYGYLPEQFTSLLDLLKYHEA